MLSTLRKRGNDGSNGFEENEKKKRKGFGYSLPLKIWQVSLIIAAHLIHIYVHVPMYNYVFLSVEQKKVRRFLKQFFSCAGY